jgi:hypothetical protein
MSEVSRETSRTLFAANKNAFDDIFGDPFAKEPLTGHYQILKSRSSVEAMKNNFDEGKATRNTASPNIIDFFCDVDKVVADTLTEDEHHRFILTYILEVSDGGLTQKERMDIEQRLGRILRAKKISPVRRYFQVVRRKTNTK